MAEGVFEFSRSLMTEVERESQDSNHRQMTVFMDNCGLVWREVETDIWLFLKLQYLQ